MTKTITFWFLSFWLAAIALCLLLLARGCFRNHIDSQTKQALIQSASSVQDDKNKCPRCDRPVNGEGLISGVCRDCKSNIANKHPMKTLVPEWSAADTRIGFVKAATLHNGRHIAAINSDEQVETGGDVTEEEPSYSPTLCSDDDIGQLKEKVQELFERHKTAIAFLQTYSGNLRMAVDVAATALGHYDLTGGATDKEIGLKHGFKGRSAKQTVNKCLQKLSKMMRLSPMEGRRLAQSRENMRKARNKQTGR